MKHLGLVALLAVLLLAVANPPARAGEPDNPTMLVMWDEQGSSHEIPVLSEADFYCDLTGSGWKYVISGGVTGWTNSVPFPCDDGSLEPIPGQVGEAQFGAQCDRYDSLYRQFASASGAAIDQTICIRFAPEPSLYTASRIELPHANQPNTGVAVSRRNMESKPDERRVLRMTRSDNLPIDPANPHGGMWGPGPTALFWWEDTIYMAYQPWLGSTYYILNGRGNSFQVPPNLISVNGADYEILLPLDWLEAWALPEYYENDGLYTPTRGENTYPPRHLFQAENVYVAQAAWLEQYGLEDWEEIAESLPEDAPLYDWRMGLDYVLIRDDVAGVNRTVMVVEDSVESTVLVNGGPPEVFHQEEGWVVVLFTMSTDTLEIIENEQTVLHLERGTLELTQEGWFVLGTNQQTVRSSARTRVGPYWFDDEAITLPTDSYALSLEISRYRDLSE